LPAIVFVVGALLAVSFPAVAGAQDAGAPAPPTFPALPEGTGAGRRVVYSNSAQRVWLVGEDGVAFDSWLV
jgi:hypothetical protein